MAGTSWVVDSHTRPPVVLGTHTTPAVVDKAPEKPKNII